MRLQKHRKLANRSLAKVNKRFRALRQEQQVTQVKPSREPLSCDIKSNLPTVSRAENVFKQGIPLNRRGEHNVPKKYLKVALYTTAGEVQGYFVYYKGSFIPVEFDFTHCFWYTVKYDNQRSCWVSHKLPTEDYNLYIPDSEVTDQSEWGPIDDGETDSNHSDNEDNKSEGQPESIDIKIPTKEEEITERQLGKLAESIPTHSQPRSHSATSRLPPISTIMAMQTTTEPMQTFAPEAGTSSVRKGGGPPDDGPNPHWFGSPGFPRGAPSRGGGGGGGGGNPPGAAAGRDPDKRSNGTKLSGKEPVIFDGDRAKAEAFLLEWVIYTMLNGDQDIMKQPFSWAMLFLTFIKGPNVQEWVGMQVMWLGRWLQAGARKTEEHLYDTIMDSFNTAFTDTMSLQKAKAEFRTIKMEKGELDAYIAKFKRLTCLAGYNLQDQMALDRFGNRLNSGLYVAIVNNEDPRNWTEWTQAAQKYQQKYLLICSVLGMKTGYPDSKPWKKPQIPEQWKTAWRSKGTSDPNAMDTTPGVTERRLDSYYMAMTHVSKQ